METKRLDPRIQDDLIEVMARWDPTYLQGPNVAQRIKDEIAFYGLDEELEREIFEYVDGNTGRILELARKKAAATVEAHKIK